jgi:hypothetical protein
MRYLYFDGEKATQIYEVLYDGLLNTTRGLEAPSETRVMSRILDKMESIGLSTERGGIKTFTLACESRVTLEDAEYQLMGEALKAVRWSSKAARIVTAALDLFSEASELERVAAG